MHIFRHIWTRMLQKTLKKFRPRKLWLRKCSVWLIFDMYLPYRELPLTSSFCKGEAVCLPRSHYQGSPETKIVYRGEGAVRGEKWSPEKTLKNLWLRDFSVRVILEVDTYLWGVGLVDEKQIFKTNMLRVAPVTFLGIYLWRTLIGPGAIRIKKVCINQRQDRVIVTYCFHRLIGWCKL